MDEWPAMALQAAGDSGGKSCTLPQVKVTPFHRLWSNQQLLLWIFMSVREIMPAFKPQRCQVSIPAACTP